MDKETASRIRAMERSLTIDDVIDALLEMRNDYSIGAIIAAVEELRDPRYIGTNKEGI